ncbi:MIP/aquaporin family protein [Methylovirgula sp. 4M-Z18]|uniref:MIP/aquaporin family protein n=1 Tax=Methylovirgula sp. 4M-Z18 TaxID=2293567 RepID=UPI000E2EDC4B|nr:MIP/aquaporin family protein [Methylovirgula sp. 4M-Z18]RFB79525.1 aquaporin family protein [Methylovirgula sp. 4M-Z18]
MGSGFIGELLGTMTLVLFGDGVVAQVLLSKSKGQNSGWIVITAGWAFAVLCGVLVAAAAGGSGHLNPAVTIAFAAVTGDWSHVATYIPAQFIGAFIGAVLVWLAYLPHWEETSDPGLKLAVFCTGPAIRNTGANIICEIIGTFALLFVVAAIGAKSVGTPGYFGPYIVAMLVWGIGLSLGGPTGYAINPARDLAPRLAHAILPIPGKGGSDWAYGWIPVFAPIVGGLIGLFVAKAAGML